MLVQRPAGPACNGRMVAHGIERSKRRAAIPAGSSVLLTAFPARACGRLRDTSLAGGNTQTMTGVPAGTLYHRWLGLHAPAMRRAVTVLSAGLIVCLALLPFASWGWRWSGAGTPLRSPSS